MVSIVWRHTAPTAPNRQRNCCRKSSTLPYRPEINLYAAYPAVHNESTIQSVSSIILLVIKYCISFEFSTLYKFMFNIYLHSMDYAFLLLQLQWIVIMPISLRNVCINQSNFSPPFTYLACMAGGPPVCTHQSWRRRQQHKDRLVIHGE